MKILCETQVINRHTQGSCSVRSAKKSTLAVGLHSSKDGNGNKEVQLIHFTPQNQAGMRYKVKSNIEKIHTRFLQDGKATISFREPPENLMIKCDPLQLKGFLNTLKLGLEGKESFNLKTNIAAATAIPEKLQPKTKMIITHRKDYPIRGFPKTLVTLTVSNIQLCKVTFDICSLRSLTVLNLSYNLLSKIPPELGRLNLSELTLRNNLLGESNDWRFLQGKNLRNSLRDLDLSANKLLYFPPQLNKLESLVTLKLNDNCIKRIPFGVRRMRCLRYLHICSNLLESLPSAFNNARVDTIDVWGNKFQPPKEHQRSLDAKVMGEQSLLKTDKQIAPLWVLAARAVCHYKLPYSPATLPWVMVDFISEAPMCACGRLCYEGSLLERAALATFDYVKNLVFCRDRLIYADIVLCGPSCAGRKQIIS